MKNLFDYATKELSQDAFLRWLFENYEDPVLGEVANDLIGKFCNFRESEKLQSLETKIQWNKIDISIWLTTTLGRKIALFIEDKTFSLEHDQLTAYNKHIDAIKDRDVYKMFFKTDLIDEDEQARIDEANKTEFSHWQVFDIDKINTLFEKYTQSDNIILSQYAEHIKRLYKAATNTTKPKSNNGNVDWLAWKAYFNKVVIPQLKQNKDKFICGTWKAGQYPYVVLYIKKCGYGERNIPYLEIQSRDCQNNEFKAKILCYGINEKDIPQQKALIENIKAVPDLECKYIKTSKKGAENFFPKQVGFSRGGLYAETDEEYISLVKKYIDIYLDVMKDWQ